MMEPTVQIRQAKHQLDKPVRKDATFTQANAGEEVNDVRASATTFARRD